MAGRSVAFVGAESTARRLEREAAAEKPKMRMKAALDQGSHVLSVNAGEGVGKLQAMVTEGENRSSFVTGSRLGVPGSKGTSSKGEEPEQDAERLVTRLHILKSQLSVPAPRGPGRKSSIFVDDDDDDDEWGYEEGDESSAVIREFAINLLQLVNERLDRVKLDFGPVGLGPETFIEVMRKHITEIEDRHRKAAPRSSISEVHYLTHPLGHSRRGKSLQLLGRKLEVLFRAIDCSHDGKASWDELSEYLIAATMQGRQAADNLIKAYSLQRREPLPGGGGYQRCHYAPALGKVLVMGRDLSVLDFPKDGHGPEMYSVPTPEGVAVNHAEHIAGHHVIATALTDMTLRFYEAYRGGKELRRHSVLVDETLMVCRAHPRAGLLFGGSRSGDLVAFSTRQGFLHHTDPPEKVLHASPHTQALTEIAVMPLDGSVATASLDGTISVVEPSVGKVLLRLTRGTANAPGISRMAYIDAGDGARFLGTCGYEADARLWVVQNQPAAPFVLRDPDVPHLSTVCDVLGVADTPQVISLDTLGMLKIWDVRVFRCVQTLRCEPSLCGRALESVRWRALCWHPKNRQLGVLAMRRLYTFSYGSAAGKSVVEAADDGISAVCYNYHRHSLVTAAGQSVHVWEAATGRLTLPLKDIAPSSITALAIGGEGRRFYIGTYGGAVCSHNFSNGALIRRLSDEPAAEVQGLVCGWGRRFVIVTRWDGACQVYNDSTGAEQLVVVPLTGADVRGLPELEPKCVAFSCSLNRLAVGDAKGFVSLWEAKVRRNEMCNPVQLCEPPATGAAEVLHVQFLDGVPVLVGVDAHSSLLIWTIPPSSSPFRLVMSWRPAELGGVESITCLGWYWPRALLYCGTSHGRVLCFSLVELLRACGITKWCPTVEAMSEQCEACGAAGEVEEPELLRAVEAHVIGYAVSSIVVDPVRKFIVTAGADRQVMLWSCVGMNQLGALDHTQRQLHSLPASKSGFFGQASTPVAEPDDADEGMPGLPPAVLPSPGVAWFGGQSFAPEKRTKEWLLGEWHAAMGRSALGGGVGAALEEPLRQRVTQATYRTVQCNEALAKLRDLAQQRKGRPGSVDSFFRRSRMTSSPDSPPQAKREASLQDAVADNKMTIDQASSESDDADGPVAHRDNPPMGLLSGVRRVKSTRLGVASASFRMKPSGIVGGLSPLAQGSMRRPLSSTSFNSAFGAKLRSPLLIDTSAEPQGDPSPARKKTLLSPKVAAAAMFITGAFGSRTNASPPKRVDSSPPRPSSRIASWRSRSGSGRSRSGSGRSRPGSARRGGSISGGRPGSGGTRGLGRRVVSRILASSPDNSPRPIVTPADAAIEPVDDQSPSREFTDPATRSRVPTEVAPVVHTNMLLLRGTLAAKGMHAVQCSDDSSGGETWFSAAMSVDTSTREGRLRAARLSRARRAREKQLQEEEEMRVYLSEIGASGSDSPLASSPEHAGSPQTALESPSRRRDTAAATVLGSPGGSQPDRRPAQAPLIARRSRVHHAEGSLAPPLPAPLLNQFSKQWRDRSSVPSPRGGRGTAQRRSFLPTRAVSAQPRRNAPSPVCGSYEAAAMADGAAESIRMLARVLDEGESGSVRPAVADASAETRRHAAARLAATPPPPPVSGAQEPLSPRLLSPRPHRAAVPRRRRQAHCPADGVRLSLSQPAAFTRAETEPRSSPKRRATRKKASNIVWDAQSGRRVVSTAALLCGDAPLSATVRALQHRFCSSAPPSSLRDSRLLGIRGIDVCSSAIPPVHEALRDM
eukprot:TRINITY_DN6651_c0_g1_i1.p1 TRINITY_DN6651_c0_g1~~TRINITY_DN6651_c0_g1_i1.p1  ORF type:complete len:1776 (+),score=326.96 TRINITY_DN6651_c0_g1_i1:62-5329(+)